MVSSPSSRVVNSGWVNIPLCSADVVFSVFVSFSLEIEFTVDTAGKLVSVKGDGGSMGNRNARVDGACYQWFKGSL